MFTVSIMEHLSSLVLIIVLRHTIVVIVRMLELNMAVRFEIIVITVVLCLLIAVIIMEPPHSPITMV